MFCRCIKEFEMLHSGNLRVGDIFSYTPTELMPGFSSNPNEFPHIINTKRGILYSLTDSSFNEYFELITEQLPETD